MGDFNTVYNPQTDRSDTNKKGTASWRPEIGLFNFLDDWSFTDVHRLWEVDEPSPTWHNKATFSRIDYMWISNNLAMNNLYSFSNKKEKMVNKSDHTRLTLKLYKAGLINKKENSQIRCKGVTNIFDTKNTTEEQWAKYKNKIEKEISNSEILSMITEMQKKNNKNASTCLDQNTNANRSMLQEIWSKIEELLLKAARATIKTKKIKGIGKRTTPGKRQDTEMTNLLGSLKLLRSLDKTCKMKDPKNIKNLREDILSFNRKNPESKLEDLSYQHNASEIPWDTWRHKIKGLYLMLRNICYKKEQKSG